MFRNLAVQISVVLLVAILLSGCSSLSFYGQSVLGHNKLMLAREPLDKAIEDAISQGDKELVENLKLASNLRDFSIQRLGLPDNRSYRSYVELNRDYPVWNVIAAPKLSLVPHQWCYLVIGCASYRGYFKERDAQNYAAQLRDRGYDVAVEGVSAYSTLGWFSDPLLSSMFRYGVSGLAELMFHELAHQVLYVNGETDFNEAFATVVGEQGAILWMQTNRPDLLNDYIDRVKVRREFNDLLLGTRKQLATLFESDLSDGEKLSRKFEIYQELKWNYSQLKKAKWAGKGWYDSWMSHSLNNANLVSVATYYGGTQKFQRLLEECEFDFSCFFLRVKDLGTSD